MEDSVENINEVEKFLVYGSEDPNDDKLDILSWWKNNVSKYKIFLFLNRNRCYISFFHACTLQYEIHIHSQNTHCST